MFNMREYQESCSCGCNSWTEPRSELRGHFKVQDQIRKELKGVLTYGQEMDLKVLELD